MDNKHCPLECFLCFRKKLNNYVRYTGNYRISLKKSSYNVFSGTGASFGGIVHLCNVYIDVLTDNLICITVGGFQCDPKLIYRYNTFPSLKFALLVIIGTQQTIG